MSIDLRKCIKGNKLRLVNGNVCEYVGNSNYISSTYPHEAKHADGTDSTYTDSGRLYITKESEFDVIEILKPEPAGLCTMCGKECGSGLQLCTSCHQKVLEENDKYEPVGDPFADGFNEVSVWSSTVRVSDLITQNIIDEIDGVLNSLNSIRFELGELHTRKMRFDVVGDDKKIIPLGEMGDAEWEDYRTHRNCNGPF